MSWVLGSEECLTGFVPWSRCHHSLLLLGHCNISAPMMVVGMMQGCLSRPRGALTYIMNGNFLVLCKFMFFFRLDLYHDEKRMALKAV